MIEEIRYREFDTKDHPHKKTADFKSSTPWKETDDVGFNWLNYDFPLLHNHEHFEILIITSGSTIHTINNVTYEMSAGNCCLIRQNDTHKFCSNSVKCQNLTFLINPAYMEEIVKIYDKSLFDKIINDKNILSFNLNDSQLSQIINRTLPLQSTNLSIPQKIIQCKITINYLLNIFFKQYLSVKDNYPKWLTEFLLLLSNPYTKFTNMQELAKNTNYSYSRLSELFKNSMGITILDYITQVKMSFSQELLKMTDKSITEISSMLNYEDVSHFNHLFKRFYGCTPMQYRKTNKGNPN